MKSKHIGFPLAIHAIFFKGDEVLLLRRFNTGYADGCYSLVAGHVERNESILSATKREVKEEVGVDVEITDLTICGSMHRKSEDERVDYFVLVKKWKGLVKNCEPNKCDDIIWSAVDALPHNTIPYIKRAISLTHKSSGIWYDEYGWNTYRYLETNTISAIISSRRLNDANGDIKFRIEKFIKEIEKVENGYKCNGTHVFLGKLRHYINTNRIVLGTPILQNVAYDSRPLSACSVTKAPLTKGGWIDIDLLTSKLLKYLAMGMGVGLDLSETCFPDKEVLRIETLLENVNSLIKGECARPIALMLSLSDTHPRIKEFICSRKGKKWDSSKINISVGVSQKDLLHENLDLLSQSIFSTGEPSLIFTDNMTKDNSTPKWSYLCTAPCAEVALSANEICHFSYLNLSNFVDEENLCIDYTALDESIHIITRMLDDTIDLSAKVIGEEYLLEPKRRFGIGIMGFATALLKLRIKYDSIEGLNLAHNILSHLQVESKIASSALASERGSFPAYFESRYQEEGWLNQKLSLNLLKERCAFLEKSVREKGIRNTSTIAFPPSGTSSRIAGVSQSFEPYTVFYEEYDGHRYVSSALLSIIDRNYPTHSGELVAQLLRNEIDANRFPEFVSSEQVSVFYQLEYTRLFQCFSDGSASKTVILHNEDSIEDIKNTIISSYDKHLKGISIFRIGSDNKYVL